MDAHVMVQVTFVIVHVTAITTCCRFFPVLHSLPSAFFHFSKGDIHVICMWYHVAHIPTVGSTLQCTPPFCIPFHLNKGDIHMTFMRTTLLRVLPCTYEFPNPEFVRYIRMIYSMQNPYIQRIDWILIFPYDPTHTHTFHTAHVVFRWLRSGYFLAKYHKLTVHRIQSKFVTF